MRVRVHGADDDRSAAVVCRAIGESPLVKTAMHGDDPNWGRVISSAGARLAGRSLPNACLYLCSVKVVEDGATREVPDDEWQSLVAGMKEREIDIDLDLGLGQGHLGNVELALGNLVERNGCYREMLRLGEGWELSYGLVAALTGNARVALAGGDLTRRGRLLRAFRIRSRSFPIITRSRLSRPWRRSSKPRDGWKLRLSCAPPC